jgi:hypothetical protein
VHTERSQNAPSKSARFSLPTAHTVIDPLPASVSFKVTASALKTLRVISHVSNCDHVGIAYRTPRWDGGHLQSFLGKVLQACLPVEAARKAAS